MREAGARNGFGLTIIPPVAEDGEVFSSSAIRLRLAQGDVKGAAWVLGRRWCIEGEVVGGAKARHWPRLSRPPTFPSHAAPRSGTASTRSRELSTAQSHGGVAYLGTRPTYDDGMPVLEVFLFDFDDDLYGQSSRSSSSTSSAPTANSILQRRPDRTNGNGLSPAPATSWPRVLPRSPPTPKPKLHPGAGQLQQTLPGGWRDGGSDLNHVAVTHFEACVDRGLRRDDGICAVRDWWRHDPPDMRGACC